MFWQTAFCTRFGAAVVPPSGVRFATLCAAVVFPPSGVRFVPLGRALAVEVAVFCVRRAKDGRPWI